MIKRNETEGQTSIFSKKIPFTSLGFQLEDKFELKAKLEEHVW
jgi:hypothetical protein